MTFRLSEVATALSTQENSNRLRAARAFAGCCRGMVTFATAASYAVANPRSCTRSRVRL